jgi:hypothetical protein
MSSRPALMDSDVGPVTTILGQVFAETKYRLTQVVMSQLGDIPSLAVVKRCLNTVKCLPKVRNTFEGYQ